MNGFCTKLKNIVSQGQGLELVNGVTTWVIRPVAGHHSRTAPRWRRSSTRWRDCSCRAMRTLLKAELGGSIDSLDRQGVRLSLAPPTAGQSGGGLLASAGTRLSVKADWHWVAERFSEDPVTRPLDNPAVLPAYNYFNFGAGFVIPNTGTRINVDLLNAFQSKGLEEGNPRLSSAGGAPSSSLVPSCRAGCRCRCSYDFGGSAPAQPQ